MDTRKVLYGTMIWSVGLFIPLLYHALLMNAAVQVRGYGYPYHAMVEYFFLLPWIVWPYLLAMGVIGAVLVVSGFRKPKD